MDSLSSDETPKMTWMKKWLVPLFIIVILLIFPGEMFYRNFRAGSEVRHIATSNKTIRDFIDAGVNCMKIAVFEVKSGQYHIWWDAGIAKYDYLASGPSVYIFDDTGCLIDYTCDIGDEVRFKSKWADFRQKNISFDEVNRIIQEKNATIQRQADEAEPE